MSAEKVTFQYELAFEQPADEIWAVIGKFDTMQDWHGAIASTEMTGSPTEVGSVRKMTTVDGAEIFEDLTAVGERSYSYRFTEGKAAFPIAAYQATISVQPASAGSLLTWNASWSVYEGGLSAEESKAIIAGVFKGVDAVKQRLDAQ
mmetsp:Transcript_14547/g.43705  ORF Transcript_14547/g.43705 Transcript_14547/m.43705 type:complete len:147 (-) Transcript_14547:20-460(-)